MTLQPTRHGNTLIFPASLDPHAVDVVTRLTNAGFESYLVGGCVRDLLLGHIPKDFDVSTEARPRQIRRVFRNCRVIGRRFKLAHVHFGDKIIEVATFRQNPSANPVSNDAEMPSGDNDGDASDLLIVRDNVFGTAEEDAVRRDFTINALLYDVASNEVIDYVGGVADIENKTLRTIGEPAIRLAEDPVRMLRAIKFTARLGLTLEPGLDKALHECAELIDRSSPARVIEEIFKLLSCGRTEQSQAMLLDYGLLQRLLPELSDHWSQHRDELVALGRALDVVDAGRRRVSNAFLLAILFHDPFRALCAEQDGVDPMLVATDLIAPAALRTSIPRRDVAHMKHILVNQLRLESSRRSRRFRMNDFLARPSTHEAIDLLYVRSLAGAIDPEEHAQWAHRLARKLGNPDRSYEKEQAASDGTPRKRRRRRSRGGRNRSRRSLRDSSADSSHSNQPSGDSDIAGSPQESPVAVPDIDSSTQPSIVDEPAVKAAAGASRPSGFKGLVRSLFRKVIGNDSRTESSTGVANENHGAVNDGSDGQTTDPGPPAADSVAQDGRDGGSAPRRRRRRHRRSGSSGANRQTESTNDSAPTSKDESAAAKKKGDDGPEQRPSRRRRSRGRRGAGRSSESGGNSSGSKPARSRSRSRRGGNGAGRPAKDDIDAQPPRDGDGESKPSQRHPEDVEDTFDW